MAAAGKWRCFRAVLQARAPIHIGWHELGLIQRTRYYIPARAMWGLLVAGLTPRLKSGPELQYEATARDLEDCLRFTCFFPATDPSDDSQLFRPKYVEKRGITYGELTAAEFESRLVYSQTSAAWNRCSFRRWMGRCMSRSFCRLSIPRRRRASISWATW